MGQRLSTLAACVAYGTNYGLRERGEEKRPRMHREDGVGGGRGTTSESAHHRPLETQ